MEGGGGASKCRRWIRTRRLKCAAAGILTQIERIVWTHTRTHAHTHTRTHTHTHTHTDTSTLMYSNMCVWLQRVCACVCVLSVVDGDHSESMRSCVISRIPEDVSAAPSKSETHQDDSLDNRFKDASQNVLLTSSSTRMTRIRCVTVTQGHDRKP